MEKGNKRWAEKVKFQENVSKKYENKLTAEIKTFISFTH